MERDNEGTLGLVRTLHEQVIGRQITSYSGQIFKTTGDGFLAEFASSVDALRCAIAIQRNVAAHHAEHPETERLEFRMGVNMGDVLLENGDVFGNGVNVAARLEGLAEPGGICLSGRVHEDAEHAVDEEFVFLGKHEVKNIQRPIEVYAVRMSQDAPLPRLSDVPNKKSGRPVWQTGSLLAVLAAVLISLLFWLWQETGGNDTAKLTQEAFELPDRPSLAVLPFFDLSPDADQAYFADGIAEDLSTDLSKVAEHFCNCSKLCVLLPGCRAAGR